MTLETRIFRSPCLTPDASSNGAPARVLRVLKKALAIRLALKPTLAIAAARTRIAARCIVCTSTGAARCEEHPSSEG